MNDDIENLLGAVEIPILFVGTDLTVRRFNIAAGLLLNLRSEAIGKPLREAKSIVDVLYLEALVGAARWKPPKADDEVQDEVGDWRRFGSARIARPEAPSGSDRRGPRHQRSEAQHLAAEEATRAATMQSQASALFASSLDYETTLESLARFRRRRSPTGARWIWSTTTARSAT
jgi:hypothetical protein